MMRGSGQGWGSVGKRVEYGSSWLGELLITGSHCMGLKGRGGVVLAGLLAQAIMLPRYLGCTRGSS
jgi:hypothetical protein